MAVTTMFALLCFILLALTILSIYREERRRFDARRQAAGKPTIEQLQLIHSQFSLVASGQANLEEVMRNIRSHGIIMLLDVDGRLVSLEQVIGLDAGDSANG